MAFLLVAAAALFLTDSSPRAQGSVSGYGCDTRRYQLIAAGNSAGNNEVYLIDGDTGYVWRLGTIGGGDKRETGFVFLPREDPRSPK